MIEAITDSLTYVYDGLAYAASGVGSLSYRVFSAACKPFEYLGSFFSTRAHSDSSIVNRITISSNAQLSIAEMEDAARLVIVNSLDILAPFVPAGEALFEVLGVCNEAVDSPEFLSHFVGGKLKFSERTFFVCIAIEKNKISQENTGMIVYMSDAPLISVALFCDIMRGIEKLLDDRDNPDVQAFNQGKERLLFIKEESSLRSNNVGRQVWVFYSSDMTLFIPVELRPDGQGGTSFQIYQLHAEKLQSFFNKVHA